MYTRLRQRSGANVGRTFVVPLFASLVFAAVFCWPLLEEFGGALGIDNDWDQHLLYHWVPYETVHRFGQVPLWNPFECGGMPMLGNPQSRWFSPFFLLHICFGPEIALQLEIVAHIALAWLGAFVLGRTVDMSRMAALAPAGVFAGCSVFYLHVGVGHTTWLPFAYLPWILAAGASGRPLIAGALLALTVGEGGVYPAPYAALALAMLALYRSVDGRSTRPLTEVCLTAVMAFCLAAPKLLVAHELMNRSQELSASIESMSPGLLVQSLFSRVQGLNYRPDGHPYGFHEYGAYLGPVPVVLALLGAWARRRAAVPWLLVGVVGLALALGYTLGGEASPWALLRRVPPFTSLGVPSRFLLLTVLGVGVLAGFGVDAFAPRAGRWRIAAILALLAAATVDTAIVATHNLRQVFQGRAKALPYAREFVQFRDESTARMYEIARANMGALTCYEPLKPEEFELTPLGTTEPHYRGEQYLLGDGVVRLVEWSPNRLVFDVGSDGPDLLVVNQNHDPSWRVVDGTGDVVGHKGLLAVRVPAGAQRIVIAYRPDRFIGGLVLAAIALMVAAAGSIRRRRARGRAPQLP